MTVQYKSCARESTTVCNPTTATRIIRYKTYTTMNDRYYETNSLFIFVTSIFSPAGTAKNNFLILASSRNRTV